MSRDDSSAAMGFLAGAVLGGVIGAGVALLFAPQSGEETRKMLKAKAKELGENFDDFKEDLEPKIKAARKDLAKKVEG